MELSRRGLLGNYVSAIQCTWIVRQPFVTDCDCNALFLYNLTVSDPTYLIQNLAVDGGAQGGQHPDGEDRSQEVFAWEAGRL